MKKLTFKFDKEATNTVRFNQVTEGITDMPAIAYIYVAKSALKEWGWSNEKTLTLTANVE